MASAAINQICSQPITLNSNLIDNYHLKLCTFNVQVFGQSKMQKSDVVDILVRIFESFDLCVMQEIRDSSGQAFPELIAELNQNSNFPGKFNFSGGGLDLEQFLGLGILKILNFLAYESTPFLSELKALGQVEPTPKSSMVLFGGPIK